MQIEPVEFPDKLSMNYMRKDSKAFSLRNWKSDILQNDIEEQIL